MARKNTAVRFVFDNGVVTSVKTGRTLLALDPSTFVEVNRDGDAVPHASVDSAIRSFGQTAVTMALQSVTVEPIEATVAAPKAVKAAKVAAPKKSPAKKAVKVAVSSETLLMLANGRLTRAKGIKSPAGRAWATRERAAIKALKASV